MSRFRNTTRRRFVISGSAVLACAALPSKTEAAAKNGSPGPQAFAIPDYERNPFLRPVGGPLQPARLAPYPTNGNGVNP